MKPLIGDDVNRVGIRVLPAERMYTDFPWPIWAVGWLAIFKAVLWLAYEPVITDSISLLLGYKYMLGLVPLIILGIGIWNLRRWAAWGLALVAVANLLFFFIYPQAIDACRVESEVHAFSLILTALIMLCNGPVGDILILCALPSMIKHTKAPERVS